MDAFRIIWYSLSVSVNAGATVIESPVCTPIGSIFSIEQMIIQLSFLSLTTSISYSFQPRTDSSIRTSEVGDASIPFSTIFINSSLVYAIPPPVPPSVNDGRMITGKPSVSSASSPWDRSCASNDFGVFNPMSFIASLKSSLSSAISIASDDAPIISTLYLSKIPNFLRDSVVLRAVWPPIVGSMASGRSFLMIFSRNSGVIGSI